MVVLSVTKLFLEWIYKFDDLRFIIGLNENANNADGSYLLVGPADDTYNNTSYQCVFNISNTIIESNTAGTITVIGMCFVNYM